MIDAKLFLVGDDPEPTVIKLKKLPMTIGRGKEADLTLAHPMVSRLHCEFYEVEGTLCIRDLGSLNGTFVGEIRVNEAALESGDHLTVGSATFKLVIGNDPVDDGIMPPTAEADGEFSTMGDSESFIDLSNEQPKTKKEARPPKKPKPEKKDSSLGEKKETDATKEANGTKQNPKKKADAETTDFEAEPIGSAGESGDGDDDLNDFLAGLK